MPQSYTPEFKKKIVRLHEEEGRTYKSITAEYGVSKASISKWCSEFSKECQLKAIENPDTPNDILNEHDRSKLIQKEADYRQQINTKKSDIDKPCDPYQNQCRNHQNIELEPPVLIHLIFLFDTVAC